MTEPVFTVGVRQEAPLFGVADKRRAHVAQVVNRGYAATEVLRFHLAEVRLRVSVPTSSTKVQTI